MAYDTIGMEVVRRRSQVAAYRSQDATGTVVKVARKYVTVEFPSELAHGTPSQAQFEKETGYERADGYTGMRYSRIATAQEWAGIDRCKVLVAKLHRQGIHITSQANATLDQVEAVARIFNVEEG